MTQISQIKRLLDKKGNNQLSLPGVRGNAPVKCSGEREEFPSPGGRGRGSPPYQGGLNPSARSRRADTSLIKGGNDAVVALQSYSLGLFPPPLVDSVSLSGALVRSIISAQAGEPVLHTFNISPLMGENKRGGEAILWCRLRRPNLSGRCYLSDSITLPLPPPVKGGVTRG